MRDRARSLISSSAQSLKKKKRNMKYIRWLSAGCDVNCTKRLLNVMLKTTDEDGNSGRFVSPGRNALIAVRRCPVKSNEIDELSSRSSLFRSRIPLRSTSIISLRVRYFISCTGCTPRAAKPLVGKSFVAPHEPAPSLDADGAGHPPPFRETTPRESLISKRGVCLTRAPIQSRSVVVSRATAASGCACRRKKARES